MKLSIIVPVYCTEATLDRCIESIVGQTFTDWELILVDDGSTDGCPAMCDEWARRDSRINVIHKENGGLSSARNAGIDAAEGEHITFVDSDDYLDTATYAEVMTTAEGCDMVEYPVCRMDGARERQRLSLKERFYDDMGEYWLKEKAYTHTYACNKIYKRWLFDEVRYPEGEVFEDVATLPHILKRAKRVATTRRGTYYYCDNDNGITSNAGGKELQMLLRNHIRAMEWWSDDAYYMEVLNRQMDVYELTRQQPMLKTKRINPLRKGLTTVQRIKALTLDIIGMKGICKVNTWMHKAVKRNRC